jgi:hypothetical protein
VHVLEHAAVDLCRMPGAQYAAQHPRRERLPGSLWAHHVQHDRRFLWGDVAQVRRDDQLVEDEVVFVGGQAMVVDPGRHCEGLGDPAYGLGQRVGPLQAPGHGKAPLRRDLRRVQLLLGARQFPAKAPGLRRRPRPGPLH